LCHEAVSQDGMKSLHHYFKSNSVLPSPTGSLSKEIPASAISCTNKEVVAVLKNGQDESGVKGRGTYQRYSGKERAEIGNYAVAHGTSAAFNHFITEFPALKYTTICEWKKVIIDISGKDPDHKSVTELPDQKRGRPSMLPEEILSMLKKYIRTIHDAGG